MMGKMGDPLKSTYLAVESTGMLSSCKEQFELLLENGAINSNP